MYFAKFNINSEIYNVYEDETLKQKILETVLENVNEKLIIVENYGPEEIKYKFCTLEKNFDEMYVAGRLVKIYKGDFSRYNEEKDDLDTFYYDDTASGITFLFDLAHEEIAFTTKKDFGRKEFIMRFKKLVEESVKDYEFEIILESNIDELKRKIKEFIFISSIEVTIIPPNGDKDDYDALFGTSANEVKNANATKYSQELTASSKKDQGLNDDSALVKRMLYGVGKGYATMRVKGKNTFNDEYTITSDQSAPLKRPISRNKADSIFSVIEIGKNYINQITAQKMGLNK